MTAEKPSNLPAMIVPPIMGAGTFTVCSTIYTLSRPGNWYWPLIHEATSFLLSILPFFALNLLLFFPVAWVISVFTRNITAAIIYVPLLTVGATLMAYHWEWLGRKPTILHPAILFGALLPALVMAIATWILTPAPGQARSS